MIISNSSSRSSKICSNSNNNNQKSNNNSNNSRATPHLHTHRPDDRSDHEHALVSDVGEGYIVVDLDDPLVVVEEVEDVRDGGGDPPSPLVEELVESLRAVGVGVGGGRVLNAVAPLEEQGAQPTAEI